MILEMLTRNNQPENEMQKFLIILTVLIAIPVKAESVKMTVPVFSQKLELAYPKGFKVGAQNQQGKYL
jgi:hypothetical protein